MALITFTWVDLEGRPAGTATGRHSLAAIDGEVFAFAVNAAGVTHIDSGVRVADLAPADTVNVAAGLAAICKVCETHGTPHVRRLLVFPCAYDMACRCGEGHASPIDNLCKFCREKRYSRAVAKRAGVKHRGDGMTLDQAKDLAPLPPMR